MKNALGEESVPCKICGVPTWFTATKLCNNCYEVTTRLDRFLKSEHAIQYVTNKLLEIELKKFSAIMREQMP